MNTTNSNTNTKTTNLNHNMVNPNNKSIKPNHKKINKNNIPKNLNNKPVSPNLKVVNPNVKVTTPASKKENPNTRFNQVELLQGYYKFLNIGKFLEQVAKTTDLSDQVIDTPVITGPNNRFVLRGSFIKKILSDIYHNPDKKNVFGYITEISSIKGITSITRELIENNEIFANFVQKKLKKQYFPFEQIVRFVRNVLNHTLDPNISLKESDFAGQKWFLNDQDKDIIFFKFKYSDFFPEWTGNKDYGIDIEVDFSKLGKGKSLFEIVNMHQLYLICELCYNLSEVFKVGILNKETIEKPVEPPKKTFVPKKKPNSMPKKLHKSYKTTKKV